MKHKILADVNMPNGIFNEDDGGYERYMVIVADTKEDALKIFTDKYGDGHNNDCPPGEWFEHKPFVLTTDAVYDEQDVFKVIQHCGLNI